MNIIKNQLTFAESMQFVNGVINSVFTQDEEGNDTDYSPASLYPLIQSTFVEMYTDYVFTDNFDENFANYISLNIDGFCFDVNGLAFNRNQYDGMLKAIEDGIEFRKQKMLQKNIKITSVLDEEIIKFANVLAEVVQQIPKGLDISSIQPFMDKINSMGTIDEKKLVKAVVNKNQSMKNRLFGHRKPKTNMKIETPTSIEE